MSTVEQTARDRQVNRAISADANEQLGAIDELVRELQATAGTYRDRSLDWGDVAALRRSRDCLRDALTGFRTAAASADLSRAAREVADNVRRLRSMQ